MTEHNQPCNAEIVAEVLAQLREPGDVPEILGRVNDLEAELNRLAKVVLQIRNVITANLEPAEALRRIERVLEGLGS